MSFMKWILAIVFVADISQSAFADDVIAPVNERFAQANANESSDLQKHVLPLMGRLGCNGRACHGSFQGQGGFRLSLFGYDLKADYESLVSGDSPRVDIASPQDSLVLQKPTMQEEHEGGKRIDIDSWQYRLLLRWIETGGPPAPSGGSELQSLEVAPARLNFTRPGDSATLKVIAKWADGTCEDVTPLCRFRSNDEAIAVVDELGVVTAVHVGDTHVVVFYDNGVQPVEVITPVNDLTGAKYPKTPTPTKIDKLVVDKLRQLGIVPSDTCTDAEFLRRASLDINGTLPTPDEVSQFLADASPDKRSQKVDELLSRPTYAAWWTTRLCDYTGNNARQLNERPFSPQRASAQWYTWIYERVKDNLPYDDLAAGIILGISRTPDMTYDDYGLEMARIYQDDSCQEFAKFDTMPFYWMRRNNRKPEEQSQAFAHAFLGVRIQCAQCHKHPFDQWTKQNYEEFTAFFNRVRFGVSPDGKKRHAEIQAYLNAPDLPPLNLNRDAPKLIAEGMPLPCARCLFSRQIQHPKIGTERGRTRIQTNHPRSKTLAFSMGILSIFRIQLIHGNCLSIGSARMPSDILPDRL